MNRLAAFFKEDSSDPTFYPTNHIVAVFPTTIEAQRVKRELDQTAPAAIAVTGEEMLEFAGDKASRAGLWGALMSEISRIIGTEEEYLVNDLNEARKGAAFVAAFCPNPEIKEHVWTTLRQCHPLAARFYGSGGIEHLVEG